MPAPSAVVAKTTGTRPRARRRKAAQHDDHQRDERGRERGDTTDDQAIEVLVVAPPARTDERQRIGRRRLRNRNTAHQSTLIGRRPIS